MGWTDGSDMTSVSPSLTATRGSPDDESLLSIFDCYGDRSLYRSLRAQFQIEREPTQCPTVSDAPV